MPVMPLSDRKLVRVTYCLLLGATWIRGANAAVIDANERTCYENAVAASYSWSPTGDRLLFSDTSGQFQLVEIATRRREALENLPRGGVAVWAHHSDQILVLMPTRAIDGITVARANLSIVEVDGKSSGRVVARGVSANLIPQWSPHDKWVLAQLVNGTLVAYEAMSGVRRTLYAAKPGAPELNGEPAWIDDDHVAIPLDGGRLVAIDVRTRESKVLSESVLFVQLVSSGNGSLWGLSYNDRIFSLKQILPSEATVMRSAMAIRVSGPDARGRFLASFADGQGFHLFDALTKEETVLVNAPGDSDPSLAPVGDRMVFAQRGRDGRGQSICVMALPVP
jgi:hypothetical protein